MDRRTFLRLSTSVTAAGMIQSYAAPLLNSVNAKSKPRDMTAAEFQNLVFPVRPRDPGWRTRPHHLPPLSRVVKNSTRAALLRLGNFG